MGAPFFIINQCDSNQERKNVSAELSDLLSGRFMAVSAERSDLLSGRFMAVSDPDSFLFMVVMSTQLLVTIRENNFTSEYQTGSWHLLCISEFEAISLLIKNILM